MVARSAAGNDPPISRCKGIHRLGRSARAQRGSVDCSEDLLGQRMRKAEACCLKQLQRPSDTRMQEGNGKRRLSKTLKFQSVHGIGLLTHTRTPLV